MSKQDDPGLQKGDAWRADWQARLQRRLADRGLHRLTDFVRARPAATLLAMADELGPDIAPVQLQWILVQEAKDLDDLRHCAIDLLCRKLNEVKGGWPSSRNWDDQEDVTFALTAWKVSLRGLGRDETLEAIITKMLDEVEIAPGWIPVNSDDATLLSVFECIWPQ